MFAGDNSNSILPFFMEGNQVPYESAISTQLQLFGNFHTGYNVNPVSYNGSNSASTRPNKRTREADDIARSQMLQISLNNFHQGAAEQSMGIPNPNAVSVGLRLSYDDEEQNSSVTSVSGSMTTLPVILSLGNNFRTEIDRQKEEFDHYFRIQEERIAKGVKEIRQRHMAAIMTAIEKGVGQKVREKEVEIENMNRRNSELAEKIKQMTAEAQFWHQKASQNEWLVNHLNQAIVQGAEKGREGCGDSEVEDAASSFNHNMGPLKLAADKNSVPKEQMTCRACKGTEVCVLLLPCRHLCLCKVCERLIEACPICLVAKTGSVEVYMS